jgi:hypothetical protein
MKLKSLIMIILGEDATIIVGDEIEFKFNMVKDISDASCETFISNFFDAIVLKPSNPIQPTVELDYPT